MKCTILDCDGTLYRYPNQNFLETRMWKSVREHSIELIRKKGYKNPEKNFTHFFEKYNGEISEAFEKELGILKDTYFQHTWGALTPHEIVLQPQISPATLDALLEITPNLAILSNAPFPWIKRVLNYLGISKYFHDNIWTGEGLIRKPLPESYLQIAKALSIEPELMVMVGDEEKNDIKVPNKLGMTTVRINPYNKKTLANYQIDNINELPNAIK